MPSRSAVALAALLSVLVAAAPAASAADCAGAHSTVATASKRVLVRATLCLLNAERTRRALRPLRMNRSLSVAARGHSRAMVAESFFSHTSLDGSTFVERIRRTGYLDGARAWSVGENIAYGSGRLSTPRAIARAWMRSPGHRANILNGRFHEIGLGVARGAPVSGQSRGGTYVTDFGTRF
jgi:uncharacterized protein YkwD